MTRGDDWRDLIGKVNCMDAFDLLRMIPDGAVDLVLTDMPYGITDCTWDTMPNLAALWVEFKRIGKKNAAFVFTASQPFTTDLINSNRKWFKYEWIWVKNRGGNFGCVKYMPMKEHENIVVFHNGHSTYNDQRQERTESGFSRSKTPVKAHGKSSVYLIQKIDHTLTSDRTASSVQKFNTQKGKHPSQKPIDMMKYFIKTYSNPGDLILDPFMGSWTTAVAAKKLGRHFIGSELSPEYCKIGEERLRQEVLDLFTGNRECQN